MVLGCFEIFFICKNENFDFIEMVSRMVVSMHWVNLKCDQNVTILHTNKKKDLKVMSVIVNFVMTS